MIRIPDELFEKSEGREGSAPPVFASELAEARQAAALTRLSAESTLALHDLDRAVDESTADPAAWADNFSTAAQRLRDDHLAAVPDPRLGEAFARDFDDLAAAKLAIVRRRAAAREVEDARAQLDETLGAYAGFAVDASSEVEASIVHDQAEGSIARMEQAGYLRAGEADELRQSYAARQDTARLDRLMEVDPSAAAEALGDPGRFPTLEPDARLHLRDRAQIRAKDQQRATAAAAFSERNGRVAALMVRLDADDADRADIMQALSDGWLRPTERDRALELWFRRRDEIRQRTDAVSRVAAALAGEGAPLDPGDSRDRTAIDIHFDDAKAAWLAAGLNEEQLLPLIADYVGPAGILPNGVRRDIAGAFRTGDPQARVRTADLIGQLPPEALKDIPQRDGAEALLILALQKTGWPPDQVAERAAAIMAGTIDPQDRFLEQDRLAITAMVERQVGGNIQLATLPSGTGQPGSMPEITSDAPLPSNENAQVALLPVAVAVGYGALALATLVAAKIASDGTRDALNQLDRSGKGARPPQPLPPPSPLPSKQETPPQPNVLPNIPPAQPATKEELIPPTVKFDPAALPPSDPNKSTVLIFEPPEFDLPIILESSKGNAKSKAEIDGLRDHFAVTEPSWKHVAGGRNAETGEEMPEMRRPGTGYAFGENGMPGDGRLGSRFADMTYRMDYGRGKLVHIQHVSVDRNGKPNEDELQAAFELAQPIVTERGLEYPDVLIFLKQWQLNRRN